MGQRPTRRAGLAKFRLPDPQLQKSLDAIIERIEVLDGIRGDSLDKAVTYRDLDASGFTIVSGAGGTNQITNTPGPGGSTGPPIPEVGPAAAPSNLATAETFLALLLTWDNPSFNVQHIEVWRADADNLSAAVLLGTTVSPQFMDYVGSNATYYYWVRAVGTDGTYSAYNDPAGTEGTTGIDPSQISIPGGGFVIQDPGAGPDIAPFIVGTVNGVTAVGLQGQFIVDGTIRASSIVADSIGAREIFVESLSVISANMGTLRSGRITTGTDGTGPDYTDQTSFRVELQDQAATGYPLWYGSGPKSGSDLSGALFYVDQNGRVMIKGILEASMIKQSYFAPSGDDDSFRIATEYVDDGSPGAGYAGHKAHLFPMKTSTFQAYDTYGEHGLQISPPQNHPPGYALCPVIQFVGPFATDSTEYGRIGTYSEMFMVQWSVGGERWTVSNTQFPYMHCILQYQYDNDGWHDAFKGLFRLNRSAGSWSQTFVSRSAPWDYLNFRVKAESDPSEWDTRNAVHYITLSVWTPNFGYADAGAILQPPDDGTPVDELPDYPQYDGNPLP